MRSDLREIIRRRSKTAAALLDRGASADLLFGARVGAARPTPVLAATYGGSMRRLVFLCLSAAIFAVPPLAPAAARDGGDSRAVAEITPRELPAEREGAVLIAIPAAGRYAIRVKSPSGARIELVDMIAGPLDSAGAAGLRDGRIDALLDKGVYKLRVFPPAGASGRIAVSVTPFAEIESATPALVSGRVASGELGDLQQRSFALDVGPEGRVGIDAIGRALGDLRLFNDAGESVDLAFTRAAVDTRPGRLMTRIRLEGALAPGRYRVTAYGGEALAWGDGAKAQPFALRREEAALLSAGVFSGALGAFGVARFEAPPDADAFRLELPDPAPARLAATRGEARETAAIAKNSRTPAVILRLVGDGKTPARLEVTGHEGQAFTLRALRRQDRATFSGAGPHLASIDLAGEGGDDPPATALLARVDADGKTRVLASDAPRIGAGRAWRGRFNLFGPTSLLFEATSDGVVAIDAKGVALDASIEPALGALAPRADGKEPRRYDLQAGFYFINLAPRGDAGGVVDVTLGPPGLAAPAPAPPPSRATISFGTQTLEKDGSYLALTNVAPMLLAGPRVVALPVELDKAPLAQWQEAGKGISLPVKLPKGGRVVAQDDKGAAVALSLADEKIEDERRNATLTVAPAAARAIGISYVPDPAPQETTKEAPTPQSLATRVGAPTFFDLAQDETRTLRFDLKDGGLYRIETLGRLKTALRVGSNLSPHLGEGEANGPGANALTTSFLRAGAYRAVVTAKESAGHLGLSIAPAALNATPKLTDAGVARASLTPDAGAAIPIEITRAGDYRLELLGLDREWRARLEDADGWPLMAPGVITTLTRRFDAGAYRLVVPPGDVDARLIARLSPVVAAPALAGHGPHILPFESPQRLQWRELQGAGAPRAPDVWRFTLHGDADVTLVIGAGMIGDIIKGAETFGRVAADRPFKARLPAGDYRVEARSLAHDDRLDYEIALRSPQLQPGAARVVTPPARLDFALARDSVVDLSTLGDKETIGVLKDASGALIERLQPRANDWSVAMSRRLPAGAYGLEIEELGARSKPVAESEERDVQVSQSDEGGDGSRDASAEDASAGPASDAPRQSGVEARITLLDEKDSGALSASGDLALEGAGAHVLRLPAAAPGTLALVAARAKSDIALAIERRDSAGVWRTVETTRGLAPALAWPAAGEAADWRALVWPLGGGATEIRAAARVVDLRARKLGDVALEPVADIADLCVAKLVAPDAALVDIATNALLAAGAAAGEPLHVVRSGVFAPQNDALWLMTRGDCKAWLRVAPFQWTGVDVALDLGAGARAHLPSSPAPAGMTRLWLARSALAQPGLDAGRGMGVTPGAALALAGATPAQLWNADGAAPLRATLAAIDVTMLAPLRAASFTGVIAPMSAQPVDLGSASAPLIVDLAGGLAAFTGERGVFADGAATTRIVHHAGASVLLVNLTQTPLPARLARAQSVEARSAIGAAFKRFMPTSGSLSLPLDAKSGDRLVVIGGQATVVSQSGRVARGRDIALDGAGEVVVEHPPGLVALWVERAGAAPWPQPAAQSVTSPQRVPLSGAAMRFVLRRDAPALLSVTSDAPALVALTQGPKRETFAFASGVDLHRFVGAGDVTLDIYTPNEGALSGALDVATQPAIPAHEGVNDAVVVAAGGGALFSFETTRDGDVGLGLRAEPDRAQARLLDASGATLGEGVAQTMKLAPGRYFVEARVPADAGATALRLAVVGIAPPPASPPEDAIADLLDKAGLKKSKAK